MQLQRALYSTAVFIMTLLRFPEKTCLRICPFFVTFPNGMFCFGCRSPARMSVLMRKGKRWPDLEHAGHRSYAADHSTPALNLFSVTRINSKGQRDGGDHRRQQHHEDHKAQRKHKARHEKRKKSDRHGHNDVQSDQAAQDVELDILRSQVSSNYKNKVY